MALYQIFNGIKSSIIPENLVLLTRSEQFWKKSAHIRTTSSIFFRIYLLKCRQKYSEMAFARPQIFQILVGEIPLVLSTF